MLEIKTKDISILIQAPPFGAELLLVDPIAWPGLRDQVDTVHIRLGSEKQIFVKTLTGKVIPLMCYDTDTIEVLKCRLQDREGIPPAQQTLIYNSELLEDERTLADYDVQGLGTIDLLLSLRGGKPVIYLFSSIPVDVRVKLSLVPSWSFSAIYPPVAVHTSKYDSITWNVHARPDKTLWCQDNEMDVAYLYWEALYVVNPDHSSIWT